jgi:hypothetical protein
MSVTNAAGRPSPPRLIVIAFFKEGLARRAYAK